MEKIKLEFSEIEVRHNDTQAQYTDGCSGSRSDCCTRTCTRNSDASDSDLDAWDKYLEVASGVIQY